MFIAVTPNLTTPASDWITFFITKNIKESSNFSFYVVRLLINHSETWLIYLTTYLAKSKQTLSVIRPNLRKCLVKYTCTNTHAQSYQRLARVKSLMWILTPPWLLFSLRGWRKRCQHDPGSRLWRGSGGKSKTLSISSPHSGVMLSQTSLIAFPVKISHVQRQAHRWFLFMEVYCLSRGNKDDRMLLRSSKSKCLPSACLSR